MQYRREVAMVAQIKNFACKTMKLFSAVTLIFALAVGALGDADTEKVRLPATKIQDGEHT